MPKLGIKCPSCGKVTTIDAARLPDKPVRLACPGCQYKIVIDKSKLLKPKEETAAAPAEPSPEAAAPEAASPQPSPPSPQPENTAEEEPPAGEPPFGMPEASPRMASPGAAEGTGAETGPSVGEPAATAEEEPPAEPQLEEPPPRELVAAKIPATPAAPSERVSVDEEASTSALPSGIVVGADKQAMHGLKQVLIPRGCSLEHVATGELESRLHQGLPPLILFVADDVGSPPCEPLLPVRQLPPVERRETFVVLVSNNLKTLDGSAAFFYEVNMILNKRDIPKAPQALGVALDAHEKLYRPFLAAIEERDRQG